MYLKFILEFRQTLALTTDGEDVSLGLGDKKQRQNADSKKLNYQKILIKLPFRETWVN